MQKKKYFTIIILGILIVLLVFLGAKGVIQQQKQASFKTITQLNVEYGQKIPTDVKRYLKLTKVSSNQKQELLTQTKLKITPTPQAQKPKIGKYQAKLHYLKWTKTVTIKVRDTKKPKLTTDYTSVDLVQGTDLAKYDFKSLFKTSDLSKVTLTFETSHIDSNKVGTYELTALATDQSHNQAVTKLKINITQAPNENQELVTQTITNDDGTKAIKNSLKDKAVVQQTTPKQATTTTNQSTNSTNTTNTASLGNQSFVANLKIAQQTSQAIIVVGNGGSYATLSMHQKVNGQWQQILSCSARVGYNGISSNSREGDGKTPAGIYSLGQAFGVASNPGSTRGWLQVNNNHYWVDDSNSVYYNQLVDASQTGIKWNSAEHLISYPVAYRYAIAINYNTAHVPYAGSAIFLHCNSNGATAGCVSVPQNIMIQILQSLQSDTLIGIYPSSSSLN